MALLRHCEAMALSGQLMLPQQAEAIHLQRRVEDGLLRPFNAMPADGLRMASQ